MSKWYQGIGNNADVVLFSKVRLARNLADSPFPSRMSGDIRKSVTKKIYAMVKSAPFANEFAIINLSDISEAQAASYAEKLLISKEFLRLRDKATFLLNTKEDTSVMLCEEDHIRINAFASGQDLAAAFEKAERLDDLLLQSFKIAYSKRLGFLTASPMNLGTGMKASLALHLPALVEENAIYKLSAMVGKLGLSLRELYKGGAGDIYILSNQVSLGISEQGAIDNLNAICHQIVKQERAARERLRKSIDFEDKIYRTLGIMKTARKLTFREFLECISLARLGKAMGYLDIGYEAIGDMLYELQEGTLHAQAEKPLTAEECARIRAQKVRDKLE